MHADRADVTARVNFQRSIYCVVTKEQIASSERGEILSAGRRAPTTPKLSSPPLRPTFLDSIARAYDRVAARTALMTTSETSLSVMPRPPSARCRAEISLR